MYGWMPCLVELLLEEDPDLGLVPLAVTIEVVHCEEGLRVPVLHVTCYELYLSNKLGA